MTYADLQEAPRALGLGALTALFHILAVASKRKILEIATSLVIMLSRLKKNEE